MSDSGLRRWGLLVGCALALGCGGDDGGNAGDGDGDAGGDGDGDGGVDLDCGTVEVPPASIEMTHGIAIASDGTIYFGHVAGGPNKPILRWRPGDAEATMIAILPEDDSLTRGVALSDGGTLFVGTPDNGGSIYSIDTTAAMPTPVREIADAGMVVGVTVGPDNAVYYTDAGAGEVRRFEPGTNMATLVTAAENPLPQPTSLAFDSDGTLLVSTLNPGTVVRLTIEGGVETAREPVIDLSAAGAFLEGVAVDSDGQIYVTDQTAGEMLAIDPGGAQATVLVTDLLAPSHMAFGRGAIECGIYIGAQGGPLGYYDADVSPAQ